MEGEEEEFEQLLRRLFAAQSSNFSPSELVQVVWSHTNGWHQEQGRPLFTLLSLLLQRVADVSIFQQDPCDGSVEESVREACILDERYAAGSNAMFLA